MNKKISFLWAVIILVIVSILVGNYIYFNSKDYQEFEVVNAKLSPCNEKHFFDGEIASDKKVQILLSCDLKTFTISGFVTQIINSSQLNYFFNGDDRYVKDPNVELVDISSENDIVKIDEDYNFDGYNDLVSKWSDGYGQSGIDSYFIFLYNPYSNKFEFNKELSKLENISIDKDRQEIKQQFCEPSCDTTTYKYINGNLKKI